MATRFGVRRRIYCFLFHNPVLQTAEPFTSSYFVPQLWLAGIRLVLFVYCLVVLVSNLIANVIHGAGWNWPVYFTTLTFGGITGYYGTATLTTSYVIWQRRAQKKAAEEAARLQMEIASTQQPSLVGIISTQPSMVDTSDSSLLPEIKSMASGQVVDLGRPPSGPPAEPMEIEEVQDTASMEATASESSSTKQRIETLGPFLPEEAEHLEAPVFGYRVPRLMQQMTLAMQWLLYESCTCFAPLVTLIYWALLFPTQAEILDTALDTWMGVSMHALNCALMGMEVMVFSKTPYRWTHFGVLLGFLVGYLAMVYIVVGVQGFYVYPFFDPRYFGGYIALVCFLAVDVAAIVWVAMLFVHRLRDREEYSRVTAHPPPGPPLACGDGPPPYNDVDRGGPAQWNGHAPQWNGPPPGPGSPPGPYGNTGSEPASAAGLSSTVGLDTVVRITLVNTQRIASGFSQALPNRVRQLATDPVDADKWAGFIKRLNAALEKAPGGLLNGVADFWLVGLATLGTAGMARDAYARKVLGRAFEAVEEANQGDLANWGLNAKLEIIETEGYLAEDCGDRGYSGSGYSQNRRDRQSRSGSSSSSAQRLSRGHATLELAVTRS
ncbi:hypothetical protein GGF46_005504 [Coemansia sp. RSA 552]|nr:hypothetical protein GGF46_005504 [Coemansia sp. RSA 552]